MTVLRADGLGFALRRHFWTRKSEILRSVSLEAEEGEIFGFLGPNGAGKTTTIKALLGLITLDAGEVTLFGESPHRAAARQRVGYMPENAYFPDTLTPRELVVKHGRLAGLSPSVARQRATQVLELVGLSSAMDRRLGTFSKGMLQRAGLAQALVGDPDLVVLDEPMSGLDPLGRRDIREIMLGLRSSGRTVFFSTHILPDVEMVCDRVGIIIDGTSRRVGRLGDMLGRAVNQVAVTADPIDAATREAAGTIADQIDAGPSSTVFRAASLEAANQLVDLLRSHGVAIREIQASSRSLEDLFVEEAEGTP